MEIIKTRNQLDQISAIHAVTVALFKYCKLTPKCTKDDVLCLI